MARKELILCDIDGAEEAHPFHFAVEDDTRVLDLRDKCRDGFTEAVAKYMAKANPYTPTKKKSGSNGDVDSAAVREWAKGAGIEVSPKGQIPAEIVEKYNAAKAAPAPSAA